MNILLSKSPSARKTIFLPAILLGLLSATSCNKENKTAAAPKVKMHLLTVHSAKGTTRQMRSLDRDLTLTISADQNKVAEIGADGTRKELHMTPASEMDPQTLQGIQQLINEKISAAGKTLSAVLPAKGGSWKDVARELQNR